MNDNVVQFPGATTIDVPVTKVLEEAIKADLEDVVVMGWTKDGQEFFSGSSSDIRTVQFLANRLLHQTNVMMDEHLAVISDGKP